MHRAHSNPHRCPHCSICPETKSMNDLLKERARVRSRVYRLHAKGEIDTEEKKTILEEVKHLWTVSDVRSYYFHPNNSTSRSNYSSYNENEDTPSPIDIEDQKRGPMDYTDLAHLINRSNMMSVSSKERHPRQLELPSVDARLIQRLPTPRHIVPDESLPVLPSPNDKSNVGGSPLPSLCADNGGMEATFEIIKAMYQHDLKQLNRPEEILPTYRSRERARREENDKICCDDGRQPDDGSLTSSPTLTISIDSTSSDNNDQDLDPDARPPEYDFVFA